MLAYLTPQPATMDKISLPSFQDAFPDFTDLTRPPQPRPRPASQRRTTSSTIPHQQQATEVTEFALRPATWSPPPTPKPTLSTGPGPSSNRARLVPAGWPYPPPSSAGTRSYSSSSSRSSASPHASPTLLSRTSPRAAPVPCAESSTSSSTPGTAIEQWRSTVPQQIPQSNVIKHLPPHRLERARQKLVKRTCSVCERVFDRPSTLAVHMSTHTGVKPFECELCGQKFTCASNKYRHLRREESCVPALGTGLSLNIPSRLGS